MSSKIRIHNIEADGALPSLTPEQNRRLSAASQALPLRHRLTTDPSFILNDSHNLSLDPIPENDSDSDIVTPPRNAKPRDSVTLFLKGQNYSIHKDDEDDFREFAAEEFTKYPLQNTLHDYRFQLWKKRKDKEFQDAMQEEKNRVEKEKKRLERQREEGQLEPRTSATGIPVPNIKSSPPLRLRTRSALSGRKISLL